MRGSVAGLTLVVGVAAAATAGASIVRDLPLRREVLLPAPAPGAWVVVTADSLLGERCAGDFADVRFADETGAVLPVVALPPRLHDETAEPLPARALAWREEPDGQRACTVDLGGPAGAGLACLAPAEGEAPWQVVECSADGAQWHDVSHVARIPGEFLPGAGSRLRRLAVDPACRHLRLRILAPAAQAAPDSLRLRRLARREAPVAPVAFRTIVGEAGPGRREWTLELPGVPPFVTGLRLDRDLREVRQDLTLEARVDRFGWRRLELSRDEDPRRLRWEPVRTSAVRLTAAGVDPGEAPLAVVGVVAARQRWALPHPGSGRLWLLYGDRWRAPRAGLPEGDFTLARARQETPLGPEEENPQYVPTGFGLAWLQRHPAALTGAMLAVLVLVTLLALGRRRP